MRDHLRDLRDDDGARATVVDVVRYAAARPPPRLPTSSPPSDKPTPICPCTGFGGQTAGLAASGQLLVSADSIGITPLRGEDRQPHPWRYRRRPQAAIRLTNKSPVHWLIFTAFFVGGTSHPRKGYEGLKPKVNALVATSLLLIVNILMAGKAAATIDTRIHSSSSNNCVGPVLKPTSTNPVDSRGKHVTSATADTAKEHLYASGGTRIRSTTPPATWNPLTATNSELQRYGFPHRPAADKERAAWEKRFSHPWKVITPEFCTTDRQYGLPSQDSNIWSGLLGYFGGYTEVNGIWQQPSFVAACPSQSGYAIWPGLGGTGGAGLIQAGTDTGTDGVNDIYTWYELISPQHKFAAVKLNLVVNPGDFVASYVSYSASGEYAQFALWNETTREVVQFQVSSTNGVPASSFYDGSTAELVIERPTLNGTVLQLRKPQSPATIIGGLVFNEQPILDGTVEARNMRNQETRNLLASVENPSFNNGVGQWAELWHNCS